MTRTVNDIDWVRDKIHGKDFARTDDALLTAEDIASLRKEIEAGFEKKKIKNYSLEIDEANQFIRVQKEHLTTAFPDATLIDRTIVGHSSIGFSR